MTKATIWRDRLPELRVMISMGLTAAEIGRQFKTTKNAVIGACHRWGVSFDGGDKPPPVPAEPAEPVMTGCRWLDGEPREFRYCGKRVSDPGGSWCAAHRAWVYYTPPDRHRY